MSSNPVHCDQGVLDTTLCDEVCQWFSSGTPVSSVNKTDRHDILTETLLKVALKTINQPTIFYGRTKLIQKSMLVSSY